MINKRGNIYSVILIPAVIIIILLMAFIFAFGTSILNMVSDVVTPTLTSVGQVGDWNATHTFTQTVTPIDSVIKSLNWLGGVAFLLSLIGMFGYAFAFRSSNEKWVIPLFFAMMFLVVICSIFISNMYEANYTGTSDLNVGLQNQSILSYLILYAPGILTICGFLAGAILFSAPGEQTA